jgi:hypothetical protein
VPLLQRLVVEMDNKEPAFPVVYAEGDFDRGMTLRDYFAAKALQGILASSTEWSDVNWNECKLIVTDSFNIADEMMKAREQS